MTQNQHGMLLPDEEVDILRINMYLLDNKLGCWFWHRLP